MLDEFLATAEPPLEVHGQLRRDGHLLLTDVGGSAVELDGPGRLEADDRGTSTSRE